MVLLKAFLFQEDRRTALIRGISICLAFDSVTGASGDEISMTTGVTRVRILQNVTSILTIDVFNKMLGQCFLFLE